MMLAINEQLCESETWAELNVIEFESGETWIFEKCTNIKDQHILF